MSAWDAILSIMRLKLMQSTGLGKPWKMARRLLCKVVPEALFGTRRIRAKRKYAVILPSFFPKLS